MTLLNSYKVIEPEFKSSTDSVVQPLIHIIILFPNLGINTGPLFGKDKNAMIDVLWAWVGREASQVLFSCLLFHMPTLGVLKMDPKMNGEVKGASLACHLMNQSPNMHKQKRTNENS